VAAALFRRKARPPSDDEFRGPFNLEPGDRVLYYQQEFTLAGVIYLVNGKERRCQYHFLDADEMHFVISFGVGPDPTISLERPIPEEDHPDLDGDAVTHDDTTFRLRTNFDATAFALGGIPAEKGDSAGCRHFDDEDELESLVVEDWGGYLEVRHGELVHENELVIKRQRDEEDWEIKPPPRIDLRSLNEARRSKQLEAREAEQRQQADELAAAREKLAAFHDDTAWEEDEDAVGLSDIVDLSYRFADEEADEEPVAEPESTVEDFAEPVAEEPAEPAPKEEPDGDPFSDVFGETPSGPTLDPYEDYLEPEDPLPDPYQEYMEPEREAQFEEEEAESGEEEEAPPALEPNPVKTSPDAPSAFLTDDSNDQFLGAALFEEEDEEVY